MNIYLADSGIPAQRLKNVWVKRHYLGSSAGIDKNLIELRELDCVRRLSRRKSAVTGTALSAWSEPLPETTEAQILAAACAAPGYSGAVRSQGAWPADSCGTRPVAIAGNASAFTASKR